MGGGVAHGPAPPGPAGPASVFQIVRAACREKHIHSTRTVTRPAKGLFGAADRATPIGICDAFHEFWACAKVSHEFVGSLIAPPMPRISASPLKSLAAPEGSLELHRRLAFDGLGFRMERSPAREGPRWSRRAEHMARESPIKQW